MPSDTGCTLLGAIRKNKVDDRFSETKRGSANLILAPTCRAKKVTMEWCDLFFHISSNNIRKNKYEIASS